MNKPQPRICIQYTEDESIDSTLPDHLHLKKWIRLALQTLHPAYEITLRFVAMEESAMLNHVYRQKPKATNVLSFPMHEILEDGYTLLGDIAICAPLVQEEAAMQQKTLEAHIAHLVIHGCLHLLDYDHEDDNSAEMMETLEIQLLAICGFDNPYQLRKNTRG